MGRTVLVLLLVFGSVIWLPHTDFWPLVLIGVVLLLAIGGVIAASADGKKPGRLIPARAITFLLGYGIGKSSRGGRGGSGDGGGGN